MSLYIGIRHEDKYKMERRAALTPGQIEKLINQYGLKFIVQSSPKRIFSDEEYRLAGAKVENDLKNCNIIFGVKEIPPEAFEAGKTYIFFSHVIKGQPYNMPMLSKMIELGCNLIDYERIVDDQNKRLIFFGKFAGLAGMINSLWSLGQRLKEYGYKNNPFVTIKQASSYHSLHEAKQHISEAASNIAHNGLPEELLPFTMGFTGYGNVSTGALEIASLLPSQEISPESLIELKNSKIIPNNIIYKVVFKEKHLSRRLDGSEFELQDYFQHPEKYESNFEHYIPHLSLLINGMYWDDRFPRIITKDYLEKVFSAGKPKLIAVGDITCDVNGSVECTHKGTTIDDPVFVYNPITRIPTMGFKGEGLLVMAVDILPSELPRDSAEAFAEALSRFIKPIADANYNQPFDKIELPPAVKKALILHNGQLTPDYKYLESYL